MRNKILNDRNEKVGGSMGSFMDEEDEEGDI